MTGMTYALAALCIWSLAGCASLFGPTISDPAIKLQWAEENLVRSNDPAVAEKLIREAMDIYAKQKDRLGLAEAHRQYGLFFRSYAVSNAADFYSEEGFLDKTVRFKDRYEKAIEHFNMSRDLFADLGRYDALASVYVSLAKTYDLTNRQDEACKAFDKSLESFARFKMTNQRTDEHLSDEIARYIDYVDAMKKQAGCSAATVPIISPPSAPPSPPAQPRDTAPSPTAAPAVPQAVSK